MCQKQACIFVTLFVALLAGMAGAAVIGGNEITATSSTVVTSSYHASNAINQSGLDGTLLLHSTDQYDMWIAKSDIGNSSAHASTASGPAWIMFEFNHVFALDEMWVWNANQSPDGSIIKTRRGLQNVAIEYSRDGYTWYKLGDYTFTEASGLADDPGFEACDFGGVQAKYVVITASTTNGNFGDTQYCSLSEVRFNGLVEYVDPNAIVDGDAMTVSASGQSTDLPLSQLVDGTGLEATSSMHNSLYYGTWFVTSYGSSSAHAGTASGPAWLEFEFDEIYELNDMWVWNANIGDVGGADLDRGLRNVTVEYSIDGISWQELGSYEFQRAPGGIDYQGFGACNFGGVSAKYVVITANENNGNWGYPNDRYALSEVQFYGTSDYATHTSPLDNATEVPVSADLSWQAGVNTTDVNGHEVYFGTDQAVVAAATKVSDPWGVYQGAQSGTTFDPGTLAAGKTYYWRVDQVGSTTLTGAVRSFTTDFNSMISSYEITATASYDFGGTYPASFAIDQSGLDDTLLLHSTDLVGEMWMALDDGGSSADPSTTVGPAWIMFEFDHVSELNEMWVWNCNYASNTDRGLRDVAIEYSPDGDTWYKLGDYNFSKASGLADDPGFEGCDFGGAKAKYVVITASTTNGNWGGGNWYSLSEVRFFSSHSSNVKEVQWQVPWTMQYDVGGKLPSGVGASAFSDGTTGNLNGYGVGYASADANYLSIDTSGTNEGCFFEQPVSTANFNLNSSTGYTVEWRVKLLDADTSTSTGAVALLAAFCDAWLSTNSAYDYDHSGTVDFDDFAVFASMWPENLQSLAMGCSPETDSLWYVGLVKRDGKVWSHQYYTNAGDPCEVMLDNDANNPDFHNLRVAVADSKATLYVDGVYASHAPLSDRAGTMNLLFGDPVSSAVSVTDYFYAYDGGGITPKDFREPAKNRDRRIIFDNDGDDMIVDVYNAKVQEFWDARLSALLQTQTDTLVYSSTHGFDQFTHNTSIGSLYTSKEGGGSLNKTQEFIDQGTDSLKMAIDFCRENDLEVFWEMRMNDVHDYWYPWIFSPFKEAHPTWLFGDAYNEPINGQWTGVDYTEPAVRDLVYRLFEEVCQNYDVDGITFEFIRSLTYFQSHADGGVASASEVQMMTDLLTDIREMADREGMKRGKPILIMARTVDSQEFSEKIGMDIETWMAKDLIDIWVPCGNYFMNHPADDVNLGHQYGIPVYPSMERPEDSAMDSQALTARRADRAFYAQTQNWLSSGADGIYVYNYFASYQSYTLTKPYPRLWHMGDLDTLKGINKTYTTSYMGYDRIFTFYANNPEAFWNYDFVNPDKTMSVNESATASMDILIEEDFTGYDPDVLLSLRLDSVLEDVNDLTVTFNGNTIDGYNRFALNTNTGYTVEWKVLLAEADDSTSAYSAAIYAAPEAGNFWHAKLLQHGGKNWVTLNDGVEVEVDSDASNPAYHTYRITAHNGSVALYVDNNPTPADTASFIPAGPYDFVFGDLTGADDSDFFVDYVYVSDDGAYPPAELVDPVWNMQYSPSESGGLLPSETDAVSYSDGTRGNMLPSYNTSYASVDANYLYIDSMGFNGTTNFQVDAASSIDIDSTSGYTVEWRVKLVDADTPTANLACSMFATPEINALWYVSLVKHDGKIWADQWNRTAGSEVEVDSDASNPDFHTLRVIVANGNATFFVDGDYVSTAKLTKWNSTIMPIFGDLTTQADADFVTEHFYVSGSAILPVETEWTMRYEASVPPSSTSACVYSDGTTGPFVNNNPEYASVDTIYLPGILHIDTMGSNSSSSNLLNGDYWYQYPLTPNDVIKGWNTIEMDLAAGKSTVTVEDLLVEIDY